MSTRSTLALGAELNRVTWHLFYDYADSAGPSSGQHGEDHAWLEIQGPPDAVLVRTVCAPTHASVLVRLGGSLLQILTEALRNKIAEHTRGVDELDAELERMAEARKAEEQNERSEPPPPRGPNL